jgi:hypothetical protein
MMDEEEYAHEWVEEGSDEEEENEADEDEEENEADDEEQEGNDEDDQDDANISACFLRREQQLFEKQCDSLRQNKPSLKGFHRDWSGDDHAIRLGNSLKGNTNLEWLWIPLGPGLTARGAEALAEGIHFSHIQRLELSGESALDSNVIRILYLEAIQTIPRLTFSYPLRDVDAIQLGRALKGNTVVQELQIRVDEFSARGALELAAGIRQSQIKRLDLMVEDESDAPVVKRILLLHAIQQSNYVRHLHISDGVCVVDALTSSLGSLQTLKLYGCSDLMYGVQDLSDSLIHALNLRNLCLNNCDLGDDEMAILSSGLHSSVSITNLCLSKNGIGDEGMSSFLEHWKDDSPIQELDLSWNCFGPLGAQQLMRAAATKSALLVLNLELNGNIGFEGMRMVGEELPNLTLRELYVDGCANWMHYADENSAAAKAQLVARDRARQAIISGIQANVYLYQIRVYFLENFQEAIQFYLNLNKSGRYLLGENNELAPTLWCRVFAKCRTDPSVLFFFLQEQPTLVSSVRLSPRKRPRLL